jgi:hypothetical protein
MKWITAAILVTALTTTTQARELSHEESVKALTQGEIISRHSTDSTAFTNFGHNKRLFTFLVKQDDRLIYCIVRLLDIHVWSDAFKEYQPSNGRTDSKCYDQYDLSDAEKDGSRFEEDGNVTSSKNKSGTNKPPNIAAVEKLLNSPDLREWTNEVLDAFDRELSDQPKKRKILEQQLAERLGFTVKELQIYMDIRDKKSQ